MRGLFGKVLALAMLPGLALAAPAGASADKRMLLFRTAIGRDNCPQAREVAASMLADFEDEPAVKLMQAQVLACEGKWVDAFVPMMAAKTAGLEVAEVETKVLAQVAIVDVVVSLDGTTTSRPDLAPSLETVSAKPFPMGQGRYRFVIAPVGQTKVFVASLPTNALRLEQGGPVNIEGVEIGHEVTAMLSLHTVPTVNLTRPKSLDPAIQLRLVGGALLQPDVFVVLPAGTLKFHAEWLPAGDWARGVPTTVPSVDWEQEMAPGSTVDPPWAFIVRGNDERMLMARLVAGDTPRVVLDGESLVVDGVKVRLRGAVERGDKGPQDVTVDIADKVADFRRARRNPSIWTWGGGALTAASVGSLVYARSAASTFAEQARSYDGLNDGDAYRADVMTVNQATLMANLSLGSAALAAGACAYGVVRGMKLPDGIDINVSTKEGE